MKKKWQNNLISEAGSFLLGEKKFYLLNEQTFDKEWQNIVSFISEDLCVYALLVQHHLDISLHMAQGGEAHGEQRTPGPCCGRSESEKNYVMLHVIQ